MHHTLSYCIVQVALHMRAYLTFKDVKGVTHKNGQSIWPTLRPIFLMSMKRYVLFIVCVCVCVRVRVYVGVCVLCVYVLVCVCLRL